MHLAIKIATELTNSELDKLKLVARSKGATTQKTLANQIGVSIPKLRDELKKMDIKWKSKVRKVKTKTVTNSNYADRSNPFYNNPKKNNIAAPYGNGFLSIR